MSIDFHPLNARRTLALSEARSANRIISLFFTLYVVMLILSVTVPEYANVLALAADY